MVEKIREALRAADNGSPGYPLWSEAMYALDELDTENERLRRALQMVDGIEDALGRYFADKDVPMEIRQAIDAYEIALARARGAV